MMAREATPDAGRVAERPVGHDEDLEEVVARLRRADAERTRLLEAFTVALEAERASLAMELHDGPIQHMSRVVLQLELAAMALDAGDVDGARRGILEAANVVGGEVNNLRRVMAALRPPALEIRGLVEAISDHVAAFATRSGIACSTDLRLAVRLPLPKEAVLFGTVQECLRNVHKHAGARHVHITLDGSRDVVMLRVRDDGRGFDPTGSGAGEGGRLGLASLRERLELSGGRFHVASAPGRGTTITATLPTIEGAS